MPLPNDFKQGDESLKKESLIQQQIAFATGLFQGDVTIHRLLESLAEGVVIIDKSGTILLVNSRAEQIFGYSKHEMIGRHHDIILPNRFHKIHTKHMESYYKEPKVRPMGLGLDLIGRHKNGSDFPVEISLSYVETVNNFFVISFVSDITLRKQVETALMERNEALDAFAHTLAHDIRNSVAVINGFGKYVFDSIEVLSKEEILESISTMIKTGDKINHIIEGLLFFATIGREDVPLVPVDMKPIILSVIERLKTSIKDNNAQIFIPDEFPKAIGYDSWIEEIWFNYISNAIKYGGNPPVVQIGANIQEHDYVTYWVQDNGKGLKPEQQITIFESYQARKDKLKQGYGLGLSIVQRIAEKLNGKVGAKSGPDGGSIFSFTLPLASKTEEP